MQSHFLFSQVVVQDGYDSDAGVDHNVATNLDGPQEIDEIDIPQVGDDGCTASNGVDKAQSSDNFVDMPPAELSKLKVRELKAELSKRGQSTNGLKAVLLDCLKNALEQCLPVLSSASQAACLTDDLTGFSANAQWKLLEPIETAVEEPQNVVPMTAPTIPINEAAFVPQKHNFSQIFDHAPFLGSEKIPKRHHNGWSVIHDGKPVFEEKVNVMGGPKTDFLLKHGLDKRSSLEEWFNAFLPLYDGTSSNPNHPKASCWSHQLANFLNMKSVILGAGSLVVSTQDLLPSVMKRLNDSLVSTCCRG